MMRNLLKIACLIYVLNIVCSCQPKKAEKYIFFLHNRFMEEHQIDELHPSYGKMEYFEILEQFKKAGFKVISEQRKGNVNAYEYAEKITKQVDSLINNGVSPSSITVVGTSKGGYIAQYVSTIANNPDLNFVFVASFMDDDIESIPNINYCGNILTIFENTDEYGVSAIERFKSSRLSIPQFKEVELNTGLQHGFIFKPLDEWINPTIAWANGYYDSIKSIGIIYRSKNLEIKKIEDDVFVHKSFLKSYNNFPCNGMIYANGGEAVVLDAPTDDSTSLELISWIENDLDCKITAIVINHFHIDCLGGLAEFHKIGVPSYANHMTIELASSDRAHNDVIPQHGFTDSIRIGIGDTYITNHYFGPGHSPDNIVSYIEDKKTLFGGCLIKANKANKGSLTDANIEEWSKTVQKVKANFSGELNAVVPGHGSFGGEELLDYTIQLFDKK